MKLQFIFVGWVLLLGAVSASFSQNLASPPIGAKPSVLILSYGRLGSPDSESNDDGIMIGSPYEGFPFFFRSKDEPKQPDPFADHREGDRAVQFSLFLEPLLKCGIEPILLDDVKLPDLPAALKAKHIPAGTIVLLNSHGGTPNGRYEVGSEYSPAGWQDGDKVVSAIAQSLESPRIWLGTCHAGACSVKYQCLGGECQASQTAADNMYAFRLLSGLICDEYSGDCSQWRDADRNHDGVIQPLELDAYLARKGNGPHELPFSTGGEDKDQLESNRAALESRCTDLHGTMTASGPLRGAWDIEYEVKIPVKHDFDTEQSSFRSDDTEESDEVVESLNKATDEASATKLLRERFPQFPDSCGKVELEDGTTVTRQHCSLDFGGFRGDYVCKISGAPFTDPDQSARSIDDFYTAYPGSFSLVSNRCADAPTNLAISR